ncbi:MAG: glycosyl transferase family 2 [Clostridia bacterium]|nr:glycosyl transferase family 2 [Clostridia bacterium]
MYKYTVYVYAICKNEMQFAQRWYNSVKEADGIIVLDTGSTDGTDTFLAACPKTQVYKEEISPWRFDTARNRSLEKVPEDADICVCIDLDEVLHKGWRAAAEAAWEQGVQQLSYRYTWNFNDDGSEGTVFMIEKIHSRHGWKWTHPVHEVLQWVGEGEPKKARAAGIQVDHLADNTKPRTQYLPLLEMSVRESPEDDRNMHYLGREYMYYRRWDDCINILKQHLQLPTAVWADERCASMRYIARSYKEKGDNDEALRWLLRACAEAPHLREPWLDLARHCADRKEHMACAAAAERCLQITQRPDTYISEAAAWGSLPWDLYSVALWHTGQTEKALEAVRKAEALAPTDKRIRANRILMQKQI